MARRHYLCCDEIHAEPDAPMWEGCDHVCPDCGERAKDGNLSHAFVKQCLSGHCGDSEEYHKPQPVPAAVPFVDVQSEAAYGQTTRMPFVVRCF